MKTDPAMCFDRMKKRARNCESEVSLDYLKAIDEKYTEYTNNHVSQKYKVHVINGNRDKEEVYSDVLQIIKSYVP
jgi:thymidylate kinase